MDKQRGFTLIELM
ncbi:prepilin-type N-terminal cleavage/methylation domain-containing protein, partial [Mycobacterium tuberculosis]|nr:prepilin-type N-terminal cleavage/methylation domain-containing protein [Mycobacterium tuberculosis]